MSDKVLKFLHSNGYKTNLTCSAKAAQDIRERVLAGQRVVHVAKREQEDEFILIVVEHLAAVDCTEAEEEEDNAVH